MAIFASWTSYHRFVSEVIHGRRFIRTPVQEAFLSALLDSAASRTQTLPTQTRIWRAQVGCNYVPYEQGGEYVGDVASPYPSDRMKPLGGRAREGRVNPKGIPHLYGATTLNTAVAETRPWLGALVSVGLLDTQRELRVVNCTVENTGRRVHFEEPTAEERERAVWRDIDTGFSTPLEPSDDVASYAPTQIIAEALRVEGYDGLYYRSALGDGLNIALFDPDAAVLTHCQVVEVKAIAVKTQNDDGPFSVWSLPKGGA